MLHEQQRFRNKVAVVTGAGMGMGCAAALAFAQEGAAVVVVDIQREAAASTVRAIEAAGGRAVAVIADVSRPEEVAWIPQAAAAFGGIDCLFNNAGIQTYGTVLEMEEETWDRTLEVNLKSVYLVSRACLPLMIERGGGTIVNMASVQGLASQRRVPAYSASKGGIIAMTRAMALDHAAQGVRVNCVCPASVDTPMLRWAAGLNAPAEQIESTVQAWGEGYPLGRVARAGEIAQVVLFLSCEQSSFITAAAIVVDGGYTAQL